MGSDNKMIKLTSLISLTYASRVGYHQNSVLDKPLKMCSTDPMTGYTRDGRCAHVAYDYGTHTVCAEMTQEFLDFTKSVGNNLSDPNPRYGFPGLNQVIDGVSALGGGC